MRLKLPASICPTCQAVLNAATNPSDSDVRPRPNDFTICVKCGQVLSFMEDMHLQMVSTATLQTIEREDPELFTELWNASMLIVKARMLID